MTILLISVAVEAKQLSGAPKSLVDRYSALFIALAAALWAADAYFRPALVKDGLSPSQIVLVEDLLISLCFLPMIRGVVRELRRASWKSWLALAIIAAGPQAFATVLFTRSLSYATTPGAESEVYLLYLLQPVFGLGMSWLILKERRGASFWPLAAVALAGAALIVTAQIPGSPTGALLAAVFVIGAVVLWAAGTVLGRLALHDVSFTTTTAMRFTLALPILFLLLLTSSGVTRRWPGTPQASFPPSWASPSSPGSWPSSCTTGRSPAPRRRSRRWPSWDTRRRCSWSSPCRHRTVSQLLSAPRKSWGPCCSPWL